MIGLPSADPYLPGHGDPSWSTRHYDLDLRYRVASNRLDADAVLHATAEVALDRVVLDLAGLEVAKVTVDGKPPARFSRRGHRLVVKLRRELAAGTDFTVAVRYSGSPAPLVERHHGDAGWEELTDGVIVAGQPHGSPTWFPCNDRPDDKATYRIAVAVEPGYAVVSNGRLESRTRRGSSVTWTYAMDRPMATYLATVQVGRYREHAQGSSDGGVAVTTWAPDDLDAAAVRASFGDQPAMVSLFERLFGPYPFEAYAAVVTADDLEIPLESQSLSTFGANFTTGEWRHTRLVAHELAHQWFGNTLTLARWRDIWLHEGFACYAEWLWSPESGGPSTDAQARAHHARLAEQPQDLVLADPGPEVMFDDRVYKRGALALHALRLTVGDEAFFALLRGWVADRADGSVTTEDFLAHVHASTGADHGPLLRRWLEETALPELPELPEVAQPDAG